MQVVPNQTARTAELQVEVLEEGPHAAIERVDVIGNKTNSAEAVLRYLDLKPGMELSSQLVGQDRGPAVAGGPVPELQGQPRVARMPEERVPLQIELAEYDKAPPLEQAFSPTEQAELKMREWLSKLDESGEDFVVNVSSRRAGTPAVELVLSPRNGLVLADEGSGPRDGGPGTSMRWC